MYMDIEKEIELIKERNKKVEVDKAWEVSSMRRLIIMVFTYATSVAWLIVIGADNPWLVAFVPAVDIFSQHSRFLSLKRGGLKSIILMSLIRPSSRAELTTGHGAN